MSFVLSMTPWHPLDIDSRLRLAENAVWKRAAGRDYETCDVTHEFGGIKRAFLLKLPPGGSIHKHVDAGDCRTAHYVLKTNPQCLNFWEEESGVRSAHFPEWHTIEVDRTVPHWATNAGSTDRIHLLVET